MTWIKAIAPPAATGRLKEINQRLAGPDGTIDNVLQIHSLRPHTLEGHMALYKSVLHHHENTLPKWLLETVGVYVSLLNGCDYCVAHHLAGLRRLLQDDARFETIHQALESGNFASTFELRERAVLEYVEQLTRHPRDLREAAIQKMRAAGLDDGAILEINQVASYFAYVNRTVLGLGVTLDGDTLGLSPNDSSDAENWQHT